MFVAASIKEQCLLPASVASVGLSAHTSMQTAPLRQQKAASAIHLSKAFFRVILWQRYKQGEPGIASALHGGPIQKNHRDAGQVIRSVTAGDVYIYCSTCRVEGCAGPKPSGSFEGPPNVKLG